MNIDVEPAIKMVSEALLNRLGEEVELIFRYGSSLKGSIHEYSDIDLSYVPVQETTWESITVMVGGTMIDFYPMHWSHLERMADFEDESASVLLNNQIIYAKNEAAAVRFQSLTQRLKALQKPDARPEMVRKALKIFQDTGYAAYLLRLEVSSGNIVGSIQQAQSILRKTLHCLAVCNQAFVDTRKMAQVLELPKLPLGFAEAIEVITQSTEPEVLLSGCERLLNSTRDLLLAEQREVLNQETTFSAVFDGSYPELKADLQRIMLACKEGNMFRLKNSFVSVYHELSRGLAMALSGIVYSEFNRLSEYEQDLSLLGFPPLLSYMINKDFEGLYKQCQLFDQHLEEFLKGHNAKLNTFRGIEELREHLRVAS